MPTITSKALRVALRCFATQDGELLDKELETLFARKIDEFFDTYAISKVKFNPLTKQPRRRVATEEIFDSIAVEGFHEFKGHEINEQAVRNAASRFSALLYPKQFAVRVHKGNARVYRKPDAVLDAEAPDFVRKDEPSFEETEAERMQRIEAEEDALYERIGAEAEEVARKTGPKRGG